MRPCGPEPGLTKRRVMTALGRGLRKRCPHCGQGPLFRGWAMHIDVCPMCHLVYERNPGDTWAFTIVGDRLPVAVAIVLVYFGTGRLTSLVGTLTLVLLGV